MPRKFWAKLIHSSLIKLSLISPKDQKEYNPGSGKTTTTIMRIGYLIEEMGVSPSRIKAVTFSRASAEDMKKRFQRFFPNHRETAVDFSTIHSLAFEVVRDYFYKNNVTYKLIEGKLDFSKKEKSTVNNNGQLSKKGILRRIFNEVTGEKISEEQLEEITSYISFIKNKLVPENEWSKVSCEVPHAKKIMKNYEKFKKNGSNLLLVDFDDMLTIANEALGKDQLLLENYQQRYDYFLTDESQDTSMVQHSIIEKLVAKHENLYVVADDDQSIYTWRAAEPQYLLNFKQVYPNAKILMMEQNYRSSKDIVDVANQFIKQNKNRYDKNMFTENPPHKPIIIKEFEDYHVQAKYLVSEIKKVENLKDVAVLFRNNSSAITLVNALDRCGIPFYIKDHDIRFFSHWVVKDILNFMRLTFNDRLPNIFEQIYTKLNLFLSKDQVTELKKVNNNKSVFENLLNLHALSNFQIKKIKSCRQTFQLMKGMAPQSVIQIIRLHLGYEEKLKEISESLGLNKEIILGVLFTLEEIADSIGTMEEFAARLNHLETVFYSSKFNKNRNVVTLSTLHSSKGLEFKHVYMIDLITGVIPSKEELDLAEAGETDLLEESVRLFYVGMTRAELHLELLYYHKKFGKNVQESPFISDVRKIISPPINMPKKEPVQRKSAIKESPKKDSIKKKSNINSIIPFNPNAITNINQLKVGEMIKHRVFGRGEIVKLDDGMINIHFQRGIKSLSIQTCLDMGLLEPAEAV